MSWKLVWRRRSFSSSTLVGPAPQRWLHAWWRGTWHAKGEKCYPVEGLWSTVKTVHVVTSDTCMRVTCGVASASRQAHMAACDRRALKHERPSPWRGAGIIFHSVPLTFMHKCQGCRHHRAYAEAGAPELKQPRRRGQKSAHCPTATCHSLYCDCSVVAVLAVSNWTSARPRSYTNLLWRPRLAPPLET